MQTKLQFNRDFAWSEARLASHMFYTLRKIVVLGFFGILALAMVLLYERRAIFAPAWDFAEAFHQWTESKRSDFGVVTGRVLQVTSGDSFQFKADDGQVFSLKLTGVEAPAAARFGPEEAARQARLSKSNLVDLVGARDVKVEWTALGAHRNGFGLVYAGATNVNVSMAASGMAAVRKSHLKGLRLMDQYALIRAGREASERGLGLWKDSEGQDSIGAGRAPGVMGHP